MLFNFCILSIRNGIKYEKKRGQKREKGAAAKSDVDSTN